MKGHKHLQDEIKELCNSKTKSRTDSALRLTAQAVYELYCGKKERASKIFAHIFIEKQAPFEAYMYYGQMLLKEGQIMLARKYFRHAMLKRPHFPKIVRLFAQSYLAKGILYRSEFAVQLATTAAQFSHWQNPWCLHVLADAYHHNGDNMSALIVASKAQNIGSKVHGHYPRADELQELISLLDVQH